MGLLQKASYSGPDLQKTEPAAVEMPKVQKKSNSVGLMKKVLTVSQNDKLDFFEFIRKYNLSLCALLKPSDGFYSIYKSFGFDGKSICLSYSTQDFWNGTITQKNNLYTYKAESSQILPFYQFFSKQLKDTIELLHLYKFDDDSIVVCSTARTFTIPETFIFDLQNIYFENDSFADFKRPEQSFNYNIDLSEALESFVLSNSKTNGLIIEAISNQIYFNLFQYFTGPSFIEKQGMGKYKLYYCIPEALPVELLSNHLRNQFKFELENHSELIKVTQAE